MFESSEMTTRAMRVEGEEPYGSRLERLEYDIREHCCKEYTISVDMSCRAGPNGRGQKPVTQKAPGSWVMWPAPDNNNNNNNQAFYSKASWGGLEMKPHEPKKGTKQERKRRGK
jgi:hypothetical protein